jgi:predicted dienelactone hydrolase
MRTALSLREASYVITFCAVLMCPALFGSSIAAQNNVGARTYHVGMTFRRFAPPEPYDWRGAQTHALTTVVWYPAESSAAEKPVEIPGLGIFELGTAARDAQPAATPARFPLIVMSHGTGGSGLSIPWLGEALAARGYVVAAVNHPGNNGTEPYTVEGLSLWWERARDLSEVITAMLADSQVGNRIDAKRIAAAGFSLGGNTMIEIAGGVTDATGFVRYCDTHAADRICTSPPEFPTLVEDFRKLIRDKPDLLKHAGDSYRDPRVRAEAARCRRLGRDRV